MLRSLVRKLLFLCLGLFALFILVSGGTANQETDSGRGRNPSDGERKLQISNYGMPAATTVSITVRNLHNENWLRDLEVEVKNNFQQPIYYLQVLLRFPDLINTELDGVERRLVIPLIYGRRQLSKLNELSTPEDVPINPGETVTLKIPEENWKGVEYYLARKKLPTSIVKTVTLRVSVISFGDGTGMKMGEFRGVKWRSSNDLLQPRLFTAALGKTDVKKNEIFKKTVFILSPFPA